MLKYRTIKGNKIHTTAVVNWRNVILGKNNTIGPYVVIGNQAQHPKKKSYGKIKIGNNNTFNEKEHPAFQEIPIECYEEKYI